MATSTTPPSPVSPLTKWLVLILASIGFAFDIYELLMLPLVGPDALPDMGVAPGSPAFRRWVATLFYVPAVFGGIFGLMGGYLTDWLGRRAVLTYSILLYAVSAFLAAYSTNPYMLLVFRCGVFVGVCVEFVAAVAWLAELFPDPQARERALGYTQAFSSVGGLLVAIAYGICKEYGPPDAATGWGGFYAVAMPEFLTGVLGTIPEAQQHSAWRYTLMSGLIPAIPLLVIRPFLPESPVWKKKKDAGTLGRPNIKELFTTPSLRTATIVTTIMFACSYGAAFGTIQQMRNIVPGLAEVKADVQEKLDKKMTAVGTQLAALKAEGKGLESLKLEKEDQNAVDILLDKVVGSLNKLEKAAKDGKVPEKIVIPGANPQMLKQVGAELKKSGALGEDTKLAVLEQVARQKISVATAGYVNVEYTKVQEIGGLIGRFLLAFLVVSFASKRALMRVFQIPGLIITPLVFFYFLTMENTTFFILPFQEWDIPILKYLGNLPFTTVSIGVSLVALCTIAQFSFWGNYLPLVYPVHLRGTGESFAANIGGRLIGTFFAAVTVGVSSLIPPDMYPTFPEQMAVAAAGVGLFVYLVGFICTFFLPEPPKEEEWDDGEKQEVNVPVDAPVPPPGTNS